MVLPTVSPIQPFPVVRYLLKEHCVDNDESTVCHWRDTIDTGINLVGGVATVAVGALAIKKALHHKRSKFAKGRK